MDPCGDYLIRNYIWEMLSLYRVDNDKAKSSMHDSTFQVAASWQANKNFLLKVAYFNMYFILILSGTCLVQLAFIHYDVQGKVGPLGSSLALAFKSWWKPAFTFSISGSLTLSIHSLCNNCLIIHRTLLYCLLYLVLSNIRGNLVVNHM